MIDLSIIIVSFNARTDLERCLESLHVSPARATQEIVVVDNASSDGSPDAARRWKDVRVIENSENVGFAAANNVGIRATSGGNLLLLNSDTCVTPGALDGLLAILEARKDVAVVGPRLVDGNGRVELSFGRMISPMSELRQKLLVRSYERGLWPATRIVRWLTAGERAPDWVSGACMMVRRSDAEAVGLLDERYFMYTEDVDFCAAIRARGRRVLFVPSAEIVHFRGRSASTAPAATLAAYRRSRLAFYEKHHPNWVPLLRLYLRIAATH